MGRTVSKLNALWVSRVTQSGRYGDGGGLYLQVSKTGAKSWLFRYTLNGKAREMGLGALALVTLAEARQKATECRKQLSETVDPLDARVQQAKQAAAEAAKVMTFDACAKSYMDAHRASWKNVKHTLQWESTLSRFASPVIGALPVQDVDTGLVMRVLEPIWWKKTETASRLRNRIELILGWASARGYRSSENPARWRNHLDKLLPRRSKISPIVHHKALPIDEVPEFLTRLRERDGMSPRALEFLILTATRTGETLGARWPEIDLNTKTWTIPAARMKAKREHRVPLTDRCIEILQEMQGLHDERVFPGRGGCQLSDTSLLMLLRRMRCPVVSHGFRSSFRDWCAERTNFPREVAEAALAHSLKDKSEAAYFRSDLFQKRRLLMEAWAEFCSRARAAGEVIEMRSRPGLVAQGDPVINNR